MCPLQDRITKWGSLLGLAKETLDMYVTSEKSPFKNVDIAGRCDPLPSLRPNDHCISLNQNMLTAKLKSLQSIKRFFFPPQFIKFASWPLSPAPWGTEDDISRVLSENLLSLIQESLVQTTCYHLHLPILETLKGTLLIPRTLYLYIIHKITITLCAN